MPWDRERWIAEHLPREGAASAEAPTPEKERAVLALLPNIKGRPVHGEPDARLVNTEAVISASYKQPGCPHLAHAHWLGDFLADKVEVWGRTLFKITPEAAARLAEPFESYEAGD